MEDNTRLLGIVGKPTSSGVGIKDTFSLLYEACNNSEDIDTIDSLG